MKKCFLTLIILFCVCYSFAQHSYHFELNWHTDTVTNLMTFDDARFLDPFSLLPSFCKTIILADDEYKVDAEIVNIVSFPINDTLFNAASEDMEFYCSYGKYANKSSCELEISPYFIDKETQQFMLVKSFDLKIKVKQSSKVAIQKTKSILSDGDWYRFAVFKSGVYELTYDDLANYGIDVQNITSDNIRIFAKEGYVLPEKNEATVPLNPSEVPVMMIDGNDGTFDAGDKLLFYIEGPHMWTFNESYRNYVLNYNHFSDTAFFYLNIGDEKSLKIGTYDASSLGNYDQVITKYSKLMYYKKETVNLMNSGRCWWSDTIAMYNSPFYLPMKFGVKQFAVEDFDRSSLMIYAAALSQDASTMTPYVNDEAYEEMSFLKSSSSYAARDKLKRYFFHPDTDTLELKFEFSTDNSSGYAVIGGIEVNFRAKLLYYGEQFSFSEQYYQIVSDVLKYEIDDVTEPLHVWNVSDPLNPLIVENTVSDGILSFMYQADYLKKPEEFVVFSNANTFAPVFVKKVDNQDLLSVNFTDYLIISYKDFMEQAEKFGLLHEKYNGFSYSIVDVDKIFNEFTCGQPDITAIRNYIRYIYNISDGEYPKNILLLGGTSYDNKNNVVGELNKIPTFQSVESLRHSTSFGTDDYFVLLDVGEGEDASGITDIPLGRLPFDDVEDMENAYGKIEHYMENRASGNGLWKHNYTLCADDGNGAIDSPGNIYAKFQESIQRKLDTINDMFNVNKIYIDAFEHEKVINGYRCPGATEALLKAFNEGSLMLTYFGHGSKLGWADENFLDVPTIQSIDNYDNMPLVISSTCEFFQFDYPGLIPAGKQLLMHSKGGTFSIISTSRVSGVAISNTFQNNYTNMFSKHVCSENTTVGDIFFAGKNTSSVQIKNIMLFGDPAVQLNYPNYNVIVDSINGIVADTAEIVFKPKELVTLKGSVKTDNSKLVYNLNGVVEFQLFDRPLLVSTFGHEYATSFDFYLRKNVIVKGKASVVNGAFELSFRMPENVGFGDSTLKFDFYAYDTVNDVTAGGCYSNVFLDNDAYEYTDDDGPVIETYVNYPYFVDGETVMPNSVLYVNFYDESGINHYGNPIGEDMLLSISVNNESGSAVCLNELFKPMVDDFRSGSVVYPLDNMPAGSYVLKIKAYDMCGNKAEKTVTFVVSENVNPRIVNLYAYPNPTTGITNICFLHNLAGNSAEITLDVFNVTGTKVAEVIDSQYFDASDCCMQYNIDDMQLKAGFYVYVLTLKTQSGIKISSCEKICVR